MPLVPCPDCGRQVSTAALSCPQCGRPNPAGQVHAGSPAPPVPPAYPERSPTPGTPAPGTPVHPRRSAPAVEEPGPVYTRVMLGMGGIIAVGMVIGMCDQNSTVASSATALTDTASVRTASVPMLSAEDSARFRQRAREIVQQHEPSGWPEADRSRMIALADTVIFFGDPGEPAVATWLAERNRAEEERMQAQAQAEAERADAAKWTYSSPTDPMASRPSRNATIDSENAVEFSFPYEGPQHATLMLRNHPSYGRDVILYIREGQILCSSFAVCTIRVRFDDGPAERWTGVGPADNSSTTVFIRNYSRFLQRMRNARVVRIQIPVYQQGEPVFEFRVGGFDNDRYTSGS